MDYKFIGCHVLFGGNGLFKSFEKMMSNVIDSISEVTRGLPLVFFGRDTVLKIRKSDGTYELKSIRNEIAKMFLDAGIVTKENIKENGNLDDYLLWFEAHDETRKRLPIIAIILDGSSITAREVHDLNVEKYMKQIVVTKTFKSDKSKKSVSYDITEEHRLDPEVCIVIADMLKYLGTGEVSATEYLKCMKKVIPFSYTDYLSDIEFDEYDRISMELVKEKPNLTKENLPELYQDDASRIIEMNIDRDLDEPFDWVRRRNRYLRMKEMREENRPINDRYQYPVAGDKITFYSFEKCDTVGDITIGMIHEIKKTPELPRSNYKTRTLKIDGIEVLMTFLCTSIGSAYHCPFTKSTIKQNGFHGVYAYAISDNDLRELDTCDFGVKIVGPRANYSSYDGTIELSYVERCRLYGVHLKCDICGFEKIPEHFSGSNSLQGTD